MKIFTFPLRLPTRSNLKKNSNPDNNSPNLSLPSPTYLIGTNISVICGNLWPPALKIPGSVASPAISAQQLLQSVFPLQHRCVALRESRSSWTRCDGALSVVISSCCLHRSPASPLYVVEAPQVCSCTNLISARITLCMYLFDSYVFAVSPITIA